MTNETPTEKQSEQTRIQAKSNEQWLAEYDAAYRYGDEPRPKKSKQAEDDS